MELQISLASYDLRGSQDGLDALTGDDRLEPKNSQALKSLEEGSYTYVLVKLSFIPSESKRAVGDINGLLSESRMLSIENAGRQIFDSVKLQLQDL